MRIAVALLTGTLCVLLTACGGGGSDDANNNKSFDLSSSAGTETNFTSLYSHQQSMYSPYTGQYQETSFTTSEVTETVNALPGGYNLKSQTTGPYRKTRYYSKLPEKPADNTRIAYQSLGTDQQLLIAHDLLSNWYTTADHITSELASSNDNPQVPVVGQQDTRRSEELLYYFDSRLQAGSRGRRVVFTYEGIEDVSVIAGDWKASKIRIQETGTQDISNSLPLSSRVTANGYMWISVYGGKLVKLDTTGTFERMDYPGIELRTTFHQELWATNNPVMNRSELSALSQTQAQPQTQPLALQQRMPLKQPMSSQQLMSLAADYWQQQSLQRPLIKPFDQF